jgi:hypothetical protein
MRAGPLSSARVVSLLNRYFVPVYVSNEDLEDGTAPAAEKAERDRIYREAQKAGLSTGTVHVYILTPDGGHPIDSLHVATAAQPDRLIDLLERAIRRLKPPGGEPLVPPVPQSVHAEAGPDDLVLHLTARSLDGRGAWGGVPAEDWIVLDSQPAAALLGPGALDVGRSWEIDPDVAAHLLTHFYPATENNDVGTNRLEQHSLRATVVSDRDGVVRVRLDGALRMRHNFYHKDDGRVVEATVVGVLDVEPGSMAIRSFRLVTEQATYGGGTFGVAVRSIP